MHAILCHRKSVGERAVSQDQHNNFERLAHLAELGVMSASLLHEIRQPLFAIKALAQLHQVGNRPLEGEALRGAGQVSIVDQEAFSMPEQEIQPIPVPSPVSSSSRIPPLSSSSVPHLTYPKFLSSMSSSSISMCSPPSITPAR